MNFSLPKLSCKNSLQPRNHSTQLQGKTKVKLSVKQTKI